MVEKASIDALGRITIPKEIRDKYNLIPGAEFEIIDKSDKIILKRLIPRQKSLEAPVEWNKDNTFFKAGQSTFGDD
jgi:AbrB family looped-hinge helix DNA binding protein